MKTADLIDEALDYWVARAEGHPLSSEWDCSGDGGILIGRGDGDLRRFAPSSEWTDGGPIIERARIGVFEGAQWPEPGKPPAQWVWYACVEGSPNYGTSLESSPGRYPQMSGPTPLIAAMRAYVASKFGSDVGSVEERKA